MKSKIYEKEDDENEKLKNKEKEDKKGKFKKITNAFSKSFIPPQNSQNSKWRDLQIRTIWSLIMIISFLLILALGHVYCAILVLIIVICINSELIDISRYKEKNAEIKNYYLISWGIFFLGIYFLYIKNLKYKLAFLYRFSLTNYLLTYHTFICFMLYMIFFFIFINSLQTGYYRYQFRQFTYNHIIILIFGISSSLIINNIFNGLIWFLLPASCVIVNDISAYIWGRMFGKHQLTPLSPKKTWEGYIGALFTTLLWSYCFSEFLVQYEFMLCPVNQVNFIPFNIFNMKCNTSKFTKIYNVMWEFPIFGKFSFNLKNIHFHSFAMAMFSSLLAPLGGLFASAFKRSLKIKDFADTIPGHGGLTDRMDCQLLNGVFTTVWLYQFVFYDEKKIIYNLYKKIDKMSFAQKEYIYDFLKKNLRF